MQSNMQSNIHDDKTEQKIHFFSTLKEDLYNDIIQYKSMVSNGQYYKHYENSDYNIDNIISNYDYRSKIITYERNISENEAIIEIIDKILRSCCNHDWETDYIEYDVDGPMKAIVFCKHCSIKKKG